MSGTTTGMSEYPGLVKASASKGRMSVAQTRTGRRSMSVNTMLKKEKEGTLYKYTKLGEVLSKLALGVPETPTTQMSSSTPLTQSAGKQAKPASSPTSPSAPAPSVPGLPKAGQQPDMPKVGSYEEKLPWYTTALGGTSGALLGQRLLPRHPVTGAIAGTLAGTGAGLEGGLALAKKLDKRTEKKADALEPVVEKAQELVAAKKKLPSTAISYIRDALREGVLEKKAEPPPPEGISMEQWDHLLSKGSDQGTHSSVSKPKKKARSGDVPTREDDFLGSEREELPTLAIAKFGATSDELCKLNAITRGEAEKSLERLQELKKKPATELARGAAVGAVAAPLLGLATRRIRGGQPVAAGLKSLLTGGSRQAVADAITGAVYGGAVPAARNVLERKVEREKLEDYVAGGRRRGFRRAVARHVGV